MWCEAKFMAWICDIAPPPKERLPDAPKQSMVGGGAEAEQGEGRRARSMWKPRRRGWHWSPPGRSRRTGAHLGGADGTGTPQGGADGPGAHQGGADGTGTPQGGADGPGAHQGGADGTGAPQGGADRTGAPQGGADGTGAPQGGADGTGDHRTGVGP